MAVRAKGKRLGLVIPKVLQGEIDGWRNMGWSGVTSTTQELLNYWFEEERDGPNFHGCQRAAIETIIYCHEILEIQNPFQLYERFSDGHAQISEMARSKVLQDELNPIAFSKYCLKMATGSGKTWVLNALLVWHYFNALNGDRPGSFTTRFLIVTPGKEVQKRIVEAIQGRKELDGTWRDPDLALPLFMPPGPRWRHRFYFETYTPGDIRENLTLTDGPFVFITNWQQFRFAKDNPSLWEDLMGEREETPKAEIIAELLTTYPDICVMNDEAHHVHATKKPNPKTKTNEELIWRRFMSYLHDQQREQHEEEPERFFQQIDFSATPFFGSGDKKDYFPHIIYDYDLAQASADMLVKQIFLEQRQGNNLVDLDFKAERAAPVGNKRRGELIGLSRGQKVMLEIGRSKLEQLTEEFQVDGINSKPVMLVLAEETEVADQVGEHFNTLSNGDGDPYDDDRVVVYHSNLSKADNEVASGRLDDIDKQDNPLQVVVSVLSVREGFDRHNIAVIVMLRASEADLLLEQVVGRGLRLMFPPYKPEYDQIQELKREARQQLKNREAPSNAFDCLFLVEHPKFKDFYENYLTAQGHTIGSGDSSKVKASGDLLQVDADVDRVERYDIAWPVQVFDDAPIPNLAEVDVASMGHYQVRFDILQKMSAKTMITDVHVETDTKAKTWELEQDYFDYSYLLQRISRAVTQTKKMHHLTSLSAEIMALADEYISQRLFTQAIEFMEPENYKVFQGLQGEQIIDFAIGQLRAVIAKATGEVQYQPGAVWRRLSDTARLLMREKNRVQVQRCIYPYQAVQANQGGFERQVIKKLIEPSPEVKAFCKLDRRHDLRIPWRDEKGIQRMYEPDFVLRTDEVIYLFETKGDHLIDDPTTALKCQAANSWCQTASRVSPPMEQPQAWEYVVLKQSVFEANSGASFTALLPQMQLQREMLVAGLYGELGLQV